MATLGPKLVLLQRAKNVKFIGASYMKENLIVTYTNNITIFDTLHKKVTKSWTVGRGQCFSTAAIYNSADEEYIVVINGNIIKTFSEDGFENGQKFTVNVPIHEIIPGAPAHVVFNNGIMMELNKVLEDPKEIPSNDTVQSDIIASQLFPDGELCYLIGKSNEYFLLFTDGTSINANLPFKHGSAKLRSCCFCQNDESFTLVSLWDDGSLCKSAISCNSTTRKPLEVNKLTSVQLPATSGNSMMASLSCDGIAVVTANNHVSVIDLKFGLEHETINDMQSGVQIISINKHLLFVERGLLSASQFTQKHVNLSSVVGKHTPSPTLLTRMKWEANQTRNESDETKIKQTELLLQSTNPAEMDDIWEELWCLHSFSQQKCLISSPFVAKLLLKLTDEKQPWVPDLLSKIIDTNKVSACMCPNLFEVILKKQDFDLLSKCLVQVKDISEKDIARCLQAIILSEQNSTQVGKLINTIMELPYTESKLREMLRQVEFEKAMALLVHLGTRLKTVDFNSDMNIDEIMSWMCIILDSHFTQIIVTPSVWDTLSRIQDIVLTHVEFYRDLCEIDVILTKLKQSFLMSRNPRHFDYNIEVMTI